MKTISRLMVLILTVMAVGCSDSNVIEAPVFPPPAPENLTATPGNGLVTLNWDAGNTQLFTSYSLIYAPSDGQPITIPNTETTFTVNGLANDTEYTFNLSTQKEGQANNQNSDPISVTAIPFEPDTTGPELTTFNFMAESNPDMALEDEDVVDLTGTIDLDNNTVEFSADNLSAYIYRDAMVATFEAPDGAVVEVDGVVQESGITINDFTAALIYDVTLDGITRSYTITVNKSQFATIPDDAFRARLVELGMPFNDQAQLDVTSTLVTEFETDGKLDIDNFGIANIKGIEFFIGTKEIDAERNSFPSINLSRNVGLKNFLAGLNATLENIQTGDLTELEIFYINDAPNLTDEVIQTIIDANTGLKRFYAQGTGTGLTSINVENLTALERLRLNEPVAVESAASINALLAKDPPIASDLGNLRVYKNDTGERCGSYDPSTYICN